ncbi:hypothetical protein CR194_12830 [Salipaludibacillus keqinensis]|uniref:Capsule synthesis protein CapA domain-containing protein n=1 Tax=Salipaludibacillus keqinensis TaxID=2045207 RepID=A0A323TAX4_9BACI|nr:CapA family protein [Salipaludibacillus keqinensis]PYZ92548.1 hypothetical protein CR194_12830 [Salipaludibacillus keqinensis]
MTIKHTITFAGDTSLGDWYLSKPNRKAELDRLKNDPFSFVEGVKPLIQPNDYFILNLETVLSDNPSGFLEGKQYPNYDNPDSTLSVLKDLGVNAVSLSNNHTMDFGSKVMLETKDKLKGAGIDFFGAGENLNEASKPLKVKINGEKSSKTVYVLTGMRASRRYREDYGFLASKETPGVNSLNMTKMTNNITKLRERDPEAVIIVCPHWQGIDYKWVTPKLEDRCRRFLEAGADFVFAHGTHMANHIEKTDKGTIVYSIGNFVFNSPGRYSKMEAPPYSLVVKLNLEENEDNWKIEPQFYPIVTDNRKTKFKVRLAKEEECKELAQLLNSKTTNETVVQSLESKDGYYLSASNDSNLAKQNNKGTSEVDLKEIIFGEGSMSKIDLTDDNTFDKHIAELENLHKEIDTKFFDFYEHIVKNKNVRNDKEKLRKLSKVVKREYLSHFFLKRFERKRISLNKAMSFKEIIVEKSALRRLGYPEYSWKLDRKTKAYQFADEIGLRRPQTDPTVYKFSEIQQTDGPIVIKPIQSTGSMGVYLIFNKNTILSAREGTYLNSWAELEEDVLKKLDASKSGKSALLKKDEWMIEELVLRSPETTEPPADLKFFCFYGEVIFGFESNRSQYQQYSFFDTDMNLIETGWDDKNLLGGSGFTKEDLDIVRSASLEIPTPFVRFDMLKGHDGLVFGEVTPRPGKFHLFNSEYDRILGEAYRRAEARITRDLLNGKKFEAFNKHFEA